MNYTKRFMVEPGTKVKLHKIDPGYIDPDVTEKEALAETRKLCKRLRKVQASLYSEKALFAHRLASRSTRGARTV